MGRASTTVNVVVCSGSTSPPPPGWCSPAGVQTDRYTYIAVENLISTPGGRHSCSGSAILGHTPVPHTVTKLFSDKPTGSAPEILELFWRSRTVRDGEHAAGNSPLKLLNATENIESIGSVSNSCGTTPRSLLSYKVSSFSVRILPHVGGKVPSR